MGLLVSKSFIEKKITNDICAICLEKPFNPQKQICGHGFCKECIDLMMKHRNNSNALPCPLCRKEMTTTERRYILIDNRQDIFNWDPRMDFKFGVIFISLIIINIYIKNAIKPKICIYMPNVRKYNRQLELCLTIFNTLFIYKVYKMKFDSIIVYGGIIISMFLILTCFVPTEI